MGLFDLVRSRVDFATVDDDFKGWGSGEYYGALCVLLRAVQDVLCDSLVSGG